MKTIIAGSRNIIDLKIAFCVCLKCLWCERIHYGGLEYCWN